MQASPCGVAAHKQQADADSSLNDADALDALRSLRLCMGEAFVDTDG